MYLDSVAWIHKKIAAISMKEWDDNNYYDDSDKKKYYYHDPYNNQFLPERFTSLDLLYWETKLKKTKNFKKVELKSNYISATDIANYTFCSIGYSISKTFETSKNVLAETGTEQHNKNRLIKIDTLKNRDKENYEPKENYAEDYEPKENYVEDYKNETNSEFFEDIENSNIIFSGHSEEKHNFFINKEIGFIGQPDYIFKNKNGEYFLSAIRKSKS